MTTGDKLYERFGGLTMVPAERFNRTFEKLELLDGKNGIPQGAIVEFGVWKGGMALALMEFFGESRSYKFFDSFDGLPDTGPGDGEDASWWMTHPEHPRYFDRCTANKAELETAISKFGFSSFKCELVEGWFADTLRRSLSGAIAFAHVDCDWYDSVFSALDATWDLMPDGGVIIVDDYYDWEGCRRAVHDFLSAKQAREPIEPLGSGCGIMIRRKRKWSLIESPHLQ